MLSLLIVLYYFPLYVQTEKSRSCDVLIGIDEDFYIQHDRNMTQLVDLAQTHIDRVNQIYHQAVFVDDFADIYFRLARVQVMFGPCASFKYENCTENREKFLEIFDQYDFRDFCLGYMFTNRYKIVYKKFNFDGFFPVKQNCCPNCFLF
ncbi:disintegrin and metalloproteinase domain-containing protein 10 [Eurytemora carolleeae]|uniref:disintegrin and metalloproteinase domain-containing protein 10 n=1 Tax=Eurytemora carolleeae TaxID=1294199 RepID=UPI000C79398E|nr:disintegrin and metalloproteinase domain-containing protein 10 [Eurytemora carolleeae]|eukprot:XP_023333656.1 disintegrin and metalloproteinase domain-containing protein 10-like [Eurytemora affinis]